MRTLIKALILFWFGLVPLAFVVLLLGPMFAPKAAPYEEPSKCDAACMDKLLAP
jgi:hypothetical protein